MKFLFNMHFSSSFQIFFSVFDFNIPLSSYRTKTIPNFFRCLSQQSSKRNFFIPINCLITQH